VTPSDDLSPPRRPIFFPVVIATVFLTIIGMTAGFVLGERDRNQASDPGDTQETSSAPIVPSTPAVDGPLCPDETIKTAADSGLPTDLRQVLKIVTDTGTTVWICQDGAGSFYYQGKTGGDSPLVQHDNGLFLTDVTRESDDEYQAIDQKGNRFVVSRTQFELHFVTGKEQINKVIAVD
jgi:hypothetical protein